MQTSVLILAAGSIRGKFPLLLPGFESPALLPVNTRALGALVLQAFKRLEGDTPLDLRLVVSEGFEDAVVWNTRAADHGCRVHGLPENGGVIETLRAALALEDLAGDIIVCLVTTVPEVLPGPGEVLVDEATSTADEWAVVDPELEGQARFTGRGTKGASGHAFTGVFRGSRQDLTEAAAAAETGDLINVIRKLDEARGISIRKCRWIDCGHDSNYPRSRAELLASRSFNSLLADPGTGLVVKRSSNTAKLRDEADYLGMLPTELATFFPRIVRESRPGGRMECYEMEYYGYPSIAEYQLYWDLTPGVWQRIFTRFNEILSAFRKWSFSIGPGQFQDFIWGKTEQRLRSLEASQAPVARLLALREIRVNGQLLAGWPACKEQVEKAVRGMYRESEFCASHGDFCFNNILCDASSGVVRLIDPRGSFGENCRGIYGDRRYDLAKLTHSATGHYDYFVNGLFQVEQKGADEFQLHLKLRKNHTLLAGLHDDLLRAQQADAREISMLTGLLFLSMLPLHAEDQNRQTAFLLRGLQFLNESLS